MAFISRRIRSLPPGQSVVTIFWSPISRREGIERHRKFARVDTKAGQHATRFQDAKTAFKRLLDSQSLDRHVDAAATGQPHDLGNWVDLTKVNGQVCPELTRHLQALGHGVYRDDLGSTSELRAECRAQPDRALGEHGHRITDLDLSALGTAETGAHDIRAHQDLLVGEPLRHRHQIDHGVGNSDVLRLAAVDRVAEAPAAQRLPVALRRAAATLGLVPVETGEALATGGVMAPMMTRCPSS
jgi:hypothetical protein